MVQNIKRNASKIELSEISSRKNSHSQPARPIAIIGIGCRYPGGVIDLESYWNLLSQGIDATSEVPEERWNLETLHDPNRGRPGKVVTRRGGFIDRVDRFDAAFFGISPREAAHIDPQQRLLLEVAWEALEDAGQIPEQLTGAPVGVFMGAFTLDYKVLQFQKSNRNLITGHTATGTMMTLIANRLSYCFDFRGPSIAVDTACSSSLVAVHLACQSLQNGECNMALAGGVNLMLTPEYTIAESKAGMLSSDGRCKTFDAKANGYARGEGAGVILLKPLDRALADGDAIHGVIRSSAVNQDGHTGGITVPSQKAQESLIREAYRRADISPHEVQYVEAHGTGTPVGDPLEANAIGSVMSAQRQSENPCYIGSVKTNFGHTEAAAGVAGLIKAVLCLKQKQIPPHLHFQKANPQISFGELGLKVPTELVSWPKTEGLAKAGVNSFGFGGTNAHVILEESPVGEAVTLPITEAKGYFLPLSARSAESLKELARSYRDFLRDENNFSLADLSYTLTQKRSHHEYRLAAIASSRSEFIECLDGFLAGEARPGLNVEDSQRGLELSTGRVTPQVVFVCSGMGPQWWGMGRELFYHEPVFRNTLERVDRIYQSMAGWSLLDEMLKDEDQSRMSETEVAQPANFALQLALAALWRSWGIVPDAVIGHSAGEAAAAYLAGSLSLEEATWVNYQRSHLQQRMTGRGKLLAVGLSLEEAERLIGEYEGITIAAINAPNSSALVGDRPTLEKISNVLQKRQVFCKFVFGNVPYHSPYMEPLQEDLLAALQNLNPQTASIPLYSTTLGQKIAGSQMDARYWWQNVRQPVLFFSALNEAIADGYNTYLELSPHPVLSGVVSECLIHHRQKGAAFLSLRRKKPELQTIKTSLGALYVRGFDLDWSQVNPQDGQLVRLPSYAWNREVYWQESEVSQNYRLGANSHHLLGRCNPGPYVVWSNELDLRKVPYLDDHRIQGTMVYPGAAYAEMGLSAIKEAYGNPTNILSLENVEFSKAMFIQEGENRQLQLILDPDTGAFKIYSKSALEENNWTLHALGKGKFQELTPKAIDLKGLQKDCGYAIDKESCYRQFRTFGLEYGETFQGIDRLWQGEKQALARVKVPAEILPQLSDYSIHPAVLDVCFQVLAAALPFAKHPEENNSVYLPTGVEEGWITGQIYPQMWIHARINEQNDALLKGDIRLLDDEGNVLLEIRGCRAMSLRDDSKTTKAAIAPGYYETTWREQERAIADRNGNGKNSREAKDSRGTWIIFSDRVGVGQTLASKLQEQGDLTVLVRPKTSDRVSIEGREYEVNPTEVESFNELFSTIMATENTFCKGVIHLWSLDLCQTEKLSIENIQEAEKIGTNAVLHLVQSMASQTWRKPPQLWLVTANSQQINEHDKSLNIAQSPLWGMARCVGHQEHLDIWGGIVDLDSSNLQRAASDLFQEILENDGEDQIAFRNDKRYVARLVDSGDLALPLAPTFRPDAAYLITGGFGGLGLLVAKWMVCQGARHLVLMTRGTFPPRSQWSQIESNSKLAHRIDAVREIEALGASVRILTADVTDEAAVTQALKDYEAAEYPAIAGVIHSAGTALPQILLQMSTEEFNRVLRPKMMGAWILHRYFEKRPLDFLVLFSSIASLVVSPGQGNYAAGNAFLDALAAYRQSRGLPGVSINWGPWGEVGMATQLDLSEFFESRGNYTISPSQGLSILGNLMAQNRPQVATVAANWSVVAQRNYIMGMAPPMLNELVAAARAGGETITEVVADGVLERLAMVDTAERQNILEAHLQELAAKVLRLDSSRFATQQPLNTLGLDSMMAIELKNYIENSLEVGLAMVDLLSGPSIAQLAEKLMPDIVFDDASEAELFAQIDNLSEEEAKALLESI